MLASIDQNDCKRYIENIDKNIIAIDSNSTHDTNGHIENISESNV